MQAIYHLKSAKTLRENVIKADIDQRKLEPFEFIKNLDIKVEFIFQRISGSKSNKKQKRQRKRLEF